MQDPFATAPAAPVEDEAQAEESPFAAPPEEAPKKAPAKKAAPKVSQTEDGKWTVTIKGGVGFDAPWLVGHMATLQEVNDQLTGEDAALLVDTMEKLHRASKKFVELGGGSPAPARSGGGGGQQSNAPQAAQEAPGGETRYCNHGEMRFRSGVSKAGKPYQAFFCSSRDRNDECKAQFLR